ncbi:MAG: phospholipase A [Burkholderiales bacterium]|nr:phospholipase A [Flavobacterium sp.]
MRDLFKNCIILLLFASLTIHGQTSPFFNTKTKIRTMTQRWELDTTATRSTFLVTPYKPIYILPARWSSAPNDQPISGNQKPEYVVAAGTNYNNIEAKFQLSFKTKVLQGILWGHGDLWMAYTQVSHWQLYNNNLSRPFREINYQPEIILNFPVRFNLFGFKARMVGVSFNHESNGKSNPFSRSWNRIIFHAGLERKNWSVYARPWLRIRSEKDDNPDIAKYTGRADLTVIYTKNGSVLSLIGSHNFDFTTKVRGHLNFCWSYPIKGNLKGFLQITHGYGETLIDYNNKQTTLGLGVSLIEWL